MGFLPRLLYRANRLRLWVTRPITVGVRVILIHDESWEIQACQVFPLFALPADVMPGHLRRLQELAHPGRKPVCNTW